MRSLSNSFICVPLLCVFACSSGDETAEIVAPKSQPKPSVHAAEAAKSHAEILFEARCGGCHLENGFGTRMLAARAPEGRAMLENRTDLKAEYVQYIVRHGIGSMPTIRAAELADADLAVIAGYLAGAGGEGDDE